MDEGKSERQSQVTTEMNQLDKGLMIIEESVASLMSRLDKVLRKSNPTPSSDKKDGSVSESLVPFADSVRTFRYRLTGTNNHIQDILNRLEL